MQNLVEAYPRIVRTDKPVEVILELKGLIGSVPACEMQFVMREVSGRRENIVLEPRHDKGGRLHFSHTFFGEQEHVLLVTHVPPSGKKSLVSRVPFYSLEDDLFSRLPFKGDFHIHSNRSDGREPPAYVAAACRRVGFDFMALTDHSAYEPSLEAIAAFRDSPADLRIFPGEEVHLPGINQHIVNFGGSFSVNALGRDKPRFEKEVAAVEAKLPAGIDAAIRHEYAACLWAYRKIREAGGIGIFCHPYWGSGYVDHTMEAIVEMHFRDMPFDAYELLGGFLRKDAESNIRQVARYHEERTRGCKIPIVGASDAHGCERGELFGWYYTIVFARSCSLDDLKEAIGSLYSVAVEALPGDVPRAHGSYRLVSYAQFLIREFFPRHDDLCMREGIWMFAHLAGDERAVEKMTELKGQTARLTESFRGKPSPDRS